MIFITLGSQKFQFNRLLMAIDKLVSDGVVKEPVYAQRGSSDYIPVNYESIDFLNREQFGEIINRASIIITHAGTGAIMGAVKRGKKVIAVPRKQEFGEHVDDHQFQIVDEFAQMNIIEPCYDIDELEKAYNNTFVKEYAAYESNTNAFIDAIEKFMESI